MTASVCPSRDELEALLDERLGPDDQQRVSGHVAGCAACQKALEALTADSSPDRPSRHGWASDEITPPPTGFLDRMKQSPPRAGGRAADGGQVPEPPSDGAVILADDGGADEPLPELDDYEILSVLGRGGEGVVYQARHRPLGRLVALKMLRGPGLGQPRALLRFRLEAETLARLRHPNIVQVYEVGGAGGRPFFAMEYVEGGALSARLHGQPQPARDAAALVETLARAVHAAHQAGVVHRDLKPGNVLLIGGPSEGVFGTPKISDFGLAKRVQVDPGLTRTGVVLGTPGYMAPEQARAEGKDVGPACDIYALGSILYHLLTGRPPFVGARPMDVLLQVVHDEPATPRRLSPRTPRDLETICLKCLHKDPRRRYATAEALAEDLRRYRDGRPVLARPTPPWERAWKAARRRPVLATLAAACTVALLLLLGGAAYYNTLLAAALKSSDANASKAADEARRADGKAAAAEAAQKKATEEAGEAKRQQGLALDAYRQLVFDVQNTMGSRPGLGDLKKKLLQTAVVGLQAVSRGEKSTTGDLTRAAAHLKLAMLFAEADDLSDADTEFAAGLAVAEDLARAGPPDAALRDVLCRLYAGRGDVLRREGRTDEALGAYRQEIDQARAWLAAEPGSSDAREHLAEAVDWAADATMSGRRTDEAKDWNRRLAEAAAEWHKNDPNNNQARFYLSSAEERRGRLLVIDGDLAAARGAFDKARAALDEVRASAPDDETYAHASRMLDVDFGNTLWRVGDAAGALPHFQSVADYYWQRRQSAADDPEDFTDQLLASQSFVDCAVAHERLFYFDDALTWYGRAPQPLAPFQSRPPSPDAAATVGQRLDEITAHTNYCKATVQALQDPSVAAHVAPAEEGLALLPLRACVFLSQGRTEDAKKAADLVDAVRPKNADGYYVLAVAYAVGAASVAPAKTPDACDAEEKALRRRFVDRALEALDHAAASGFKDAERLKSEPRLDPLRREPAFQALVQRLEKSP